MSDDFCFDMEIQVLDKDLLSALHERAVDSPRLRMNFDLRTTVEDGSQRMLNALEQGTHAVHDGEVAADEKGFAEVARFRICPREQKYGIQIPLGVWHSIEVYEPSTIFEAKDGAYIRK